MSTQRKSRFSGKVSGDAARQTAAGSSYGHLLLPKGISVFKETMGKVHTVVDIIPYEVSDDNHPDKNEKTGVALKGDLWYKRPYKMHRNIGAGNDTVVCLTSIGKRCPICEYRAKMSKEGAAKEDIKALKASERNLYVVIPIGMKDFDEKPYIWDISQYLFQVLLNQEVEERPNYEVFPDLEVGYTLDIRFESTVIPSEKGSSKPFATASRIDFEDRKEAYDESILDDVPDLDKVLKILSYKELEAKFLELDDEDVQDKPEEEEAPVRSARKRKTEVEEDDDESEEKPIRRRKTAPEPEEEPDDEEPEEKETKPARTRKPREEPETKTKNRCPHGHKFGVDTDDHKECAACKIWDDCIDEKEANEKN